MSISPGRVETMIDLQLLQNRKTLGKTPGKPFLNPSSDKRSHHLHPTCILHLQRKGV